MRGIGEGIGGDWERGGDWRIASIVLSPQKLGDRQIFASAGLSPKVRHHSPANGIQRQYKEIRRCARTSQPILKNTKEIQRKYKGNVKGIP